MKVFSSVIWVGLRFRQLSHHFTEAVAMSGARGGFSYLTGGFKASLRRRFIKGAGRSKTQNEFDAKWGTDTSGRILARELGISPQQAIGASPFSSTDAGRFHDLIARLKINYSEYAFVDCGSGKGLVVLLASRYPFKSIAGVEFSPILHEIAEANLLKIDRQNQRCHNIKLVCQDATEYQFPEGPCVVYIYNPFREARLFEKWLDGLSRSLAASPRDLIIVYLNPAFVKCLEAASAFERVEDVRFGQGKEDWAVIFRSRNALAL